MNIKKPTATIDYKGIFEIELRHSYFEDGKLYNFTVKPAEASLRLLQEFDLRIVKKENIIRVFAPETTNVTALIESGITLQFDVFTTDLTFINYTQLPLNAPGFVLFKNDYALGNPALLSPTYQTTANPSQTLGRISINFANLSYTENQEPFTYTAQFTARAVRIKYIFIIRHDVSQLNLKGDDAALFSGPYPSLLPDGANAQVFDSGTNLILLSEQPKFQRTLEFLNYEVVASIDLPFPRLEITSIENDRLVCLLYVSL
jgi:hypothetical protein